MGTNLKVLTKQKIIGNINHNVGLNFCPYTEKGRYHNIEKGKRICQMCDMNDVEDEYHFILKCPFLYKFTIFIYKKYYWSKPSVFKLVKLLSVQNRKELCNIGKYLKHALYIRSQYM